MALQANKENTIAFYKTACLGNPKGAMENYVGACIEDYLIFWLGDDMYFSRLQS